MKKWSVWLVGFSVWAGAPAVAQVRYYGLGYKPLSVQRAPLIGNAVDVYVPPFPPTKLHAFVFGAGPWLHVKVCARTLYVVPLVVVEQPRSGILRVEIPKDPWLVGRSFKVQWFGLSEPGCKGLLNSNAAEVRIAG